MLLQSKLCWRSMKPALQSAEKWNAEQDYTTRSLYFCFALMRRWQPNSHAWPMPRPIIYVCTQSEGSRKNFNLMGSYRTKGEKTLGCYLRVLQSMKRCKIAVANAHPVLPHCKMHVVSKSAEVSEYGRGAHSAVLEDHLAEIIVKAPGRLKYYGFRGPRKADDQTVSTRVHHTFIAIPFNCWRASQQHIEVRIIWCLATRLDRFTFGPRVGKERHRWRRFHQPIYERKPNEL